MALNAGNLTATSGLAKRIADYIATNETACGLGAYPAGAQTMMKALAYCIAQAVVDEIVANAAVTITIHTTDTGLQTSAGAGSATTGPATNKTVTGGTVA